MEIHTTTLPSVRGDVTVVELTNTSGARVRLSSLGAGIVAIEVPDREGKLRNVTLTYADPANDYFEDGPCMGKTPGRYANRIALGKFTLDGVDYQLATNNGPNHLHGGPTGFQNQIWNTEILPSGQVKFSLTSAAGHEGYPGTVEVACTYTFTDDNTLTIRYDATTDAATPINLTNHTYFNLHGVEKANGLAHNLRIAASHWLPTNDSLAPTGEIASVKGTPMDFTEMKEVGRDIHDDFEALRFGKGYDNCWVLDTPGLDTTAAVLESPISGIRLEVVTDQPAVQVYTGNWLDGCPRGEKGETFHDYDGVAIECQGCPDAPNHPNFPSQILRPGETYTRTIEFRFPKV